VLEALFEGISVVVRLEGGSRAVEGFFEAFGHLGELVKPVLRGVWLALA